MALTTIYPNGTSTVDVPATESIAISNYGGGIASIYYLVENANRPNAFQLQRTLENAGVVLGAFADGKTVKIEAGGSTVVFDVGASPDTGIGDADTLNGMASDAGDTADTIAARDGSGDITANAFESTVATGTAPLTVASTTVVANLNADTVDGIQGSNLAKINTYNTFTASQGITASSPLLLITDTFDNHYTKISRYNGDAYIQFYGNLFLQGEDGSPALEIYINDGTGNKLIYHAGNLGAGANGTLQLPALASDPASGEAAGQIYYNTTSNVIRFYNGSAWGNV